jgi:hypothetical protein
MSKEPGPRMTLEELRGELITNVPTWFLKSVTYKGEVTGWLRGIIEKEIKKRGDEYVKWIK